MTLARPDVPKDMRKGPRRFVNAHTTKSIYTAEVLGAILGIPHEILRVSYDSDRHIVTFYVFDAESEQRWEGQEPMEFAYTPPDDLHVNRFPTEEQTVSIIANAIGYGVETAIFNNEDEDGVISVEEERADVYKDIAATILKQIQEVCRP